MGFTVKDIPYFKKDAFDFFAFISTLVTADEGSIIILHSCAHNPTGCDPTRDQWMEIASIVKQRRLFPIFDSAYLGFNSGSVDEDKWAIKYFTEEMGMEAAVCLSFAKSMGLYGERIGLVAFVVRDADLAVNVQSVLENCQRATISGPPAYGARIASEVLNDPVIREQWGRDLLIMSGRIRAMRARLYFCLLEMGELPYLTNINGLDLTKSHRNTWGLELSCRADWHVWLHGLERCTSEVSCR